MRRPTRVPFRTRPLVALVIITAWLATLLVSTATSSSAQLEPGATPTLSGPAAGTSLSPSFTIGNVTSGDSVECGWEGPNDALVWGACTTSASFVPTLPNVDATYTIWTRAVRTVAVPTTVPSPTETTSPTPDPNSDPDTPVASITPTPTTVPEPTTSPALDQSPAASATYVLRQTGPTLTRTSGPATATGSGSVQWTYTAEGFAVSCTLTGPSSFSVTAPCGASDPAFPGAALTAEGAYSIVATAYDGPTPSTSTAPETYTVDTTAPTASISGSTGSGTSNTVAWTVTLDEPGTTSCVLKDSAGTTLASGGCGQFSSYALPTVEDTYTLSATGVDLAGLPTATAATRSYTYDVAPGAATVTGPTSPGNATTVSWTVTTQTTAGTTVSCVVTGPDGFSRTALCNPGTSTFSTSLQNDNTGLTVDGTYTLTASVTDGGGTSSDETATYDLDHTAPTVVITPNADNSTTPAAGWTVNVTDGGAPTCDLKNSAGTSLGTGTGCAQFTSFTLPAKDTYTFTATSVDGVNNSSTASDTWIYRDAPTVTVTTDAPTGNSTSVSWHVNATAGTNVACTLTDPDSTPHVIGCTYASSPATTVSSTEGTSTFSVIATDPQTGFTGTDSATYVYDVTPPPAFTVDDDMSDTDGDRNTRATNWSWSDAGYPSTCRLLLAGANYGSAGSCTSPYTTAVPSDGSWQLRVTLTDAAGNTRTATSAVVRVDTVAPAQPGVTTPKALSNDLAPVWTITGEATATFTCSWTSVLPATLPASGPCVTGYAPTLPSTDDTYTLHVVQTDVAGNDSAERTFAYTLDLIAPTTTFSVEPTSPGSNPSVSWTTTVSETSAKTECRLIKHTTGPDLVVYDWRTVSCGRTVSATLTDGDGSYVMQVRDTDPAGNVVAAGTSSTPFDLDTTGPGVPGIVGPSGWNSDPNVTWTITDPAGETPAAYYCRLVRNNNTNAASWVRCDSQTFTTTLPNEATYRLDVESADALGNRSTPTAASADYLYDPNPPSPATFTGTDATGNATSRTWTWTPGEPQLTPDCRLYTVDGGTRVLVNTELGCSSPHTETLAASTPGTTYVLEVTLVDRAGNSTPSDGPSYLLDTVAPIAPQVDGPSGTNSTRAATYTFVPSEAGTTATCQLMQRPTNSTTWTAVQTSAPCATPWIVTLPNVDGDYATRVVTRDAAGNDSLYGESQTYTLDVTGPVSPAFLTGPTGTANTKPVAWTWSYEALSTGECTLRHGTTVLVNATACDAGTYSTTLSDGDGDYTLTVRLTDQYGNIGGTTTSVTYTLDATPPGAPDVSGPTTTSNNTTANYAITSVIEGGATAECRLERGTTVVNDWASCTMPTSRVLSGDGLYVFKVRLTDQYGNVGLPGSSPGYLLDTTPPTRPAVTAPASPSHDLAPVFSVTIDADTTPSSSLARGSSVVAAAPSCVATFTGALAGLSDGDYVLTVTAKDAAGNTTSGTSPAYTLDTTPPPAPVVTGQAGPSQTRNPAFSWTSEAGSRSECATQLKDQPLGGWGSCTSPYSPSLASDGTWTLSVRLIDAADNVSAAGTSGPYVLDTTAPNAPAVQSPASPGRDLAPSWSADVEPGSKTECRFSGPGRSETTFTPCTLPLSTPVGGDGTYVLEVRATDTAGNVSPIGTGSYVLDTTPPPAPVVNQPTGPGRTRSPLITYTAEAGTTGSCRVTRGATVVVETAACSSPVQLNLGDLPDGAYTLTVRAVDAAGNTGPAATGTYVLDTTAPALPTMTLITGSPSSDRAPSFGFSVEPGTTPICRLTTPGGVRDLSCISPVTLDLSNASEGEYTLAITARDSAGNTSAAATAGYTLDNSAPAAPRITGPATPDKSRTPTWKISATGKVECRLLRGTATYKDWAACGSTYTADLYGQPDAIYLLEARIVGTTAQTTSRYRLDTTGPGLGAAVITAPPSPSTVRKPVWSIASSEVGATAQCRVAVFGALLKDWTDCEVSPAGSLFSYDLTGLGDGIYTLSVRLTDSAGNVSTSIATSDYDLDTSAPAAVGVIAPKSPDRDTTPTWTLSSTSGAKLECRVTSGQKVIKEFSSCSGTFTIDLSSQPDGTYTLTVHALSAAGTPGAETTSSYVLDKTPVDAPTGLSTSQRSPSSNRTPKWQFTLPDGSVGARCIVSVGTAVIADGPCTAPYTMDLTTAKDGSYVLKVMAIDAAGNESSPATAGYTLRTAPAPDPEFVQEPGSPSSTTDPTWSFSTAYDVTTECRVLYEGALQDGGTWFKCPDQFTLLLTGPTPKPDGRYTLQVRGVDVAGNLSKLIESTYVFDRSAAPLAVFLSSPASPGNDLTPTWTVSGPTAPVTSTSPGLLRASAVGGSGLECQLTAPGRAPGNWAACSGTYTANTVGEGKYVLGIRSVDAGGATGPVSTSAYRLVTKKPAPLDFTETPPAAGNDDNASWSWEDNPLVRVQCRFGRTGALSSQLLTCIAPPFTANVSRLGQGAYTFETRVVDRAGNQSDSTLGTYRYDTTPPPAASFSARPPARGSAGSVTWTFPLAGDAVTAMCVVTHDGQVDESPCNGTYSLSGLSRPGTWLLSVYLVDAAGNRGPALQGSYTLTTFVARDHSGGSGSGNGGGHGSPRPGDDSGFGVSPPVGHDPFLGPRVSTKSNLPGHVATAVKNIAKSLTPHVNLPRVGIPEGTGVPDAIKNVIGSTITKPQLPLALFVIVVLFLLVQNRIDRRDPKLAAAPVEAEPELEFGPRVRFLNTGGATA
jgi:hypothetical protein